MSFVPANPSTPMSSRQSSALSAPRIPPEHLAGQPALVSERCWRCVKGLSKAENFDSCGDCSATRYSACAPCKKEKCEQVPKRWRRAANLVEYIHHAAKTSATNSATHRTRLEGYCVVMQKRFTAAAHRSLEERNALESLETSAEFKINWDRWMAGAGGVGACHPTNEVVDGVLERALVAGMSAQEAKLYYYGN